MDVFFDMFNVVVNMNYFLLVSKLLKMRSEEKKENLVQYLYDFVLLNQNMLKGLDLIVFVN